MKKKELMQSIAQRSGETQAATERTVSALLEQIEANLKAGVDTRLDGLGTFAASERAERQGRNPKSGEAMTIPAAKVVRFKASTVLKRALND